MSTSTVIQDAEPDNFSSTHTAGRAPKHLFAGLPAQKPFVADAPQPTVTVNGLKPLPSFNNVTPIIAAPH